MLETVCVCVPRHLMIGKGSITSVVEALGKIGAIKNPLIVTDKVMVEIGVVARLQKLLAQGGLTSAVYDAVRPDPTDEMVLMGIDILESGCHDAVIGLGGGSPTRQAGNCNLCRDRICAARTYAIQICFQRNICISSECSLGS